MGRAGMPTTTWSLSTSLDTTAPAPTITSRIVKLGRAAWRAEVGIWQSFYRWIFRRPRVPNS